MKIEKIERTSVSKACTLYGDKNKKRFCFWYEHNAVLSLLCATID